MPPMTPMYEEGFPRLGVLSPKELVRDRPAEA